MAFADKRNSFTSSISQVINSSSDCDWNWDPFEGSKSPSIKAFNPSENRKKPGFFDIVENMVESVIDQAAMLFSPQETNSNRKGYSPSGIPGYCSDNDTNEDFSDVTKDQFYISIDPLFNFKAKNSTRIDPATAFAADLSRSWNSMSLDERARLYFEAKQRNSAVAA